MALQFGFSLRRASKVISCVGSGRFSVSSATAQISEEAKAAVLALTDRNLAPTRTLLTSLVVAREWERGTMEALLSTPITRVELLLTKIIPYFGLGMVSMAICLIISTLVLGVPFRGSLMLLFLATALFLGTALGLGLLLSTAIRSQFNAAQAALNAAFLPVMMLSGFVYEIGSMPRPVQVIASILPPSMRSPTCTFLYLPLACRTSA